MSEKTIDLENFKEYIFAKTATIRGEYNKLDLDDKSLIKDSNFKFRSLDDEGNVLINVTNLDDMFNGCINATFSHSLNIDKDVEATSAKRMFKNCNVAKLPTVNITESKLTDCSEMFSGCENATMKGVNIPKNAANVKAMFKNCKKCAFNEINEINNTITDFTELFYGCSNGVFGRLKLPDAENKNNIDRYNFSHTFYDCDSLESNTLGFENISEYTSNSDFMFYNAGEKSSSVFDDKVIAFGSIQNCTSMFENSNFAFDNTFLQFYSNGSLHKNYRCENNVNSISRLFYGAANINDKAPVILLSDTDIYDITTAENIITSGFDGHYVIENSNSIKGLIDFSYLYANSSAKTIDLRGISYNTVIDGSIILNNKSIQNFTGMALNCENLKTIIGHLPPNAYSYEDMFKGCPNLEVDLGGLFKKQPFNWSGNVEDLEEPSENGDILSNYHMKNIKSIFENSDKLYSTSDKFDLLSVVKTVKNNNTEDDASVFRNAFSSIKIATKNPVLGLEDVDYDIKDISKKTGIIRYSSLEDEVYETMGSSYNEFGIYSDYMMYMFHKGFYRFGGYFKSDKTKYFCVMYRPLIDIQSGNVINFFIDTKTFSNNYAPHGFSENYNIDKTKGYWNEVKFDAIYAAKIFNVSDNSFYKNAYVGSYTRLHKERINSGGKITTITTETQMPVTYFDSLLGDIPEDL